MKIATLSIKDNEIEHPLFRACMQIIVGVRDGHSESAMQRYATTLEQHALLHVGPINFVSCDE